MGSHARKRVDTNWSTPTEEEEESGLVPLCMTQSLPCLVMSLKPHGGQEGGTHHHPTKQTPFTLATSPGANEAGTRLPKL